MIWVYIKPDCPYCKRLLRLLERDGIEYDVRDVSYEKAHYDTMINLTRDSGVPQVRMNNVMIFDYDTESTLVDDIKKISEQWEVETKWMDENTTSKFVILTGPNIEK